MRKTGSQKPEARSKKVWTFVVMALSCPGLFAQTAPSAKDLKYPPLPQVKIPEPVQATLPNGMRIFLLEEHELPIVTGFALVRTGNLFDPPDKRGLSEIMAPVLRTGGTKSRTGDQLDELLEGMAASVESSPGETSASVSFSSLRENVDRVLEIFKDVLANPEFRQDKVDLAKTQLRSSISRRNDDAGSIASRELASIVYGRNNPYGWMIEYEHVARIQRQDLIDFYRRYYFPKNMLLAVYGDFNTAEMKARLEKLFADWTVEQPPVPPFPPVTVSPAAGIYLAEKTDVTQTFFEIGHLGGVLKDKDYPALEVTASILGGGFSSRLMTRVRTQLGYAYSIGASWGANYGHPGLFSMSGSTKSASTVDTLREIRSELEKLRTKEVTAEELQRAKDGVLNSFVFRFDRPSKTLNRLLTYEYWGYPKDFIFQYQKAVSAVTRADVLRVASTYMRPENLAIVCVGNPKEFGTPLSELGKVIPIDLTIPEPKTESAKADPKSAEAGVALLKRVQQALGGADKLAAIKDTSIVLERDISSPAGALKAKVRSLYVAPSHIRQEQEFPFGKVTVYFDGTAGWLISPQGSQDMPPPVVRQVQGELFRIPHRLLLSDHDPGRTVSLAAPGAIQISSKEGFSARLEVDEKTLLPSKISYQESGQTVELTFSDWRDVDGLKFAFASTMSQGNQKANARVLEYRVNTGLQAAELAKKP